ncbi:MAG TPA: F0F1 ATP synthase subunit A [Rectinemataceae bacterium]|nr:F0F1 ATP synthase subunit A [Rectinemataceae bacterium]
MTINPDKVVLFRLGPIPINETIFFTWIAMAVIALLVLVLGRGLSVGTPVSRSQGLLEALFGFLESQIVGVTGGSARAFLPFLGSLFVFILSANVLEIVPLYHPPTASLSTTAALAACVFFAVPAFGIAHRGLSYFKDYLEPSPIMLPFTIVSELSRTLSLAMRLFGNIMSESLIAAVLLSIVPLFVPLVFQAFGLLIGTIQAYIFFTLATVYVSAAAVGTRPKPGKEA